MIKKRHCVTIKKELHCLVWPPSYLRAYALYFIVSNESSLQVSTTRSFSQYLFVFWIRHFERGKRNSFENNFSHGSPLGAEITKIVITFFWKASPFALSYANYRGRGSAVISSPILYNERSLSEWMEQKKWVSGEWSRLQSEGKVRYRILALATYSLQIGDPIYSLHTLQ